MRSVIQYSLTAVAAAIMSAALTIWLAPRPSAPADDHGHGGHDHGAHGGAEHGKEEPSAGVVALSEEAVNACGIRTEEAKVQRLSPVLATTATIRPNADSLAHIRPRINGRITEVRVKLGQHVKKGDVLAILDSVELGLNKAEFIKAQSLLDIARSNHERQQALNVGKITTERSLQEAKAELIRADAELRALREKLVLYGVSSEELDKIGPDKPTLNLSIFPVVSPFDGIVIEKHLALGEVVGPEDNLATLADLSTVWILIDVFQQDAPKVHEGQRVELSSDSIPGEIFEGKITNVGAVLSEETRTLQARVEIANPRLVLKPGTFVRANIRDTDAEHSKEALAVPITAIQYIENIPILFVEERPGEYQKRDVLLGTRFGDWWEVVSGVKAGDAVVTQGGFILKSELMREKIGGHSH